MKSRSFCLSEADSNSLQMAFQNCHKPDTRNRYLAVRLYGNGYSLAQIQDICACSRNSLMLWARAYRQSGLAGLVDRRKGGNHVRLQPAQIEQAQNQLRQFTPTQLLGKDACAQDGQFWNIADLATLLERDYGVVYNSPTSYRNLLKRCHFSYQCPAKQYKSHSEFKLMHFEEALEKKTGRHSSKCPRNRGIGGG